MKELAAKLGIPKGTLKFWEPHKTLPLIAIEKC